MKNSTSNKAFGIFFCGVFFIVACYSYLGGNLWLVSLSVLLSVSFLAFALRAPDLLSSLNRHWHGFGLLLGKIISPIVLGLIFFLLITPVSLLTRLFGRDELKLKKRSVQSYWIGRSPPGPPSDSFKNQY